MLVAVVDAVISSLSTQVGVLERLNRTLTPSPPVYPQLSCKATLTMI